MPEMPSYSRRATEGTENVLFVRRRCPTERNAEDEGISGITVDSDEKCGLDPNTNYNEKSVTNQVFCRILEERQERGTGNRDYGQLVSGAWGVLGTFNLSPFIKKTSFHPNCQKIYIESDPGYPGKKFSLWEVCIPFAYTLCLPFSLSSRVIRVPMQIHSQEKKRVKLG